MPLKLELTLPNDARAVAAARAYVRETAAATALEADAVEALVDAAEAATRNAIQYAYSPGESGQVRVATEETPEGFVLSVHDWGLPFDPSLGDDAHPPHHGMGSDVIHRAADDVQWIILGNEGKAIRLLKRWDHPHIADHPEGGDVTPFHDAVQVAPAQEYEFRHMRDAEAVQVSRLMYRTYGNTYCNPDLYYPDRVRDQNRSGTVLSYVAVAENGEVVGHSAYERGQPGPVVERGQAAVNPAHRGRHILERLNDLMGREIPGLRVAGVYADAVAVHPITQKTNEEMGSKVCGVSLAIEKAGVTFKNINEAPSQRVTCILYFRWAGPPAPRDVHLPARHEGIIREIYANLGVDAAVGKAEKPAGRGELNVTVEASSALATIRVATVGADTVAAVRRAKRDLIEHGHAQAIYVELPLSQPGTALAAEDLDGAGFGFAGVGPHFAPDGDVLRLVYLTDELHRDAIVTYSEFAGRLTDYCLEDQRRLLARA